MGYDLHITKKEFWADEEGAAIDRESWDSLVDADPDIRQDENNSKDDFLVTTGLSEWPIWWDESGELYTKNPCEIAVTKLKEIAKSLGATVQGDDGEFYE